MTSKKHTKNPPEKQFVGSNVLDRAIFCQMELWELTAWILMVLFMILFCSFVISICFFPYAGKRLSPESSKQSSDSPASTQVPVTVVMPIEETCMRCLEPIAGAQCRELRCSCLVHVECLLDWWKESAETRPRREVESGVLQLDCRKCRKTVSVPSYLPGAILVTRGELQQAHI